MFTHPHRNNAEPREIDVVTETLRDLVDSMRLMNTVDLNELATLVVCYVLGIVPGVTLRFATL